MANQCLQIPPTYAAIDRAHPLSRGLVFCWHPNAGKIAAGGGGIAYDLASKSLGSAGSGISNSGVTKFTSDKIWFADRADHKQTNNFTVFLIALDASNFSTHTYISCDTAANASIGFSIFSLGSTQYRWRVGNGSFVDDITESVTTVLNTAQSFALVYSGKPGSAGHVAYRNGVNKGNTTSGVSYAGNDGIRLGWAESNGSSGHLGYMYCCYIWNHVLSPKAIYDLDANPFQFFTWPGKNEQVGAGSIKTGQFIDGSPFSKVVR